MFIKDLIIKKLDTRTNNMCLGLRCEEPGIEHHTWIPQRAEFLDQGLNSLRFLMTTHTLTNHVCDILDDESNLRLRYWKRKCGIPMDDSDWTGKHLGESEWENTYSGALHPETPLKMAIAEVCVSWVRILKVVHPWWREVLRDKSVERNLIVWVIHPELQIYSYAMTRSLSLKAADCHYMALKVPN